MLSPLCLPIPPRGHSLSVYPAGLHRTTAAHGLPRPPASATINAASPRGPAAMNPTPHDPSDHAARTQRPPSIGPPTQDAEPGGVVPEDSSIAPAWPDPFPGEFRVRGL